MQLDTCSSFSENHLIVNSFFFRPNWRKPELLNRNISSYVQFERNEIEEEHRFVHAFFVCKFVC